MRKKITSEDLRVGMEIKTERGWFTIVGVWIRGGLTSNVDVVAAGKLPKKVCAKTLCEHIIDRR
jgi:hypothetical protein